MDLLYFKPREAYSPNAMTLLTISLSGQLNIIKYLQFPYVMKL